MQYHLFWELSADKTKTATVLLHQVQKSMLLLIQPTKLTQ